MPWPMQGTVEAIMAQEGRVTIGKYLDFTKEACEEDRNNRAALGTRAAAVGGSATDVDEVFFDAEEQASLPSSSSWASSGSDRVAPAPTLVPYEPMGRDEAALRCLLQIHASCSETAALMRQVQQSLQRMDDNIGAIRAAVVMSVGPAASSRTGVHAASTGEGGGSKPRGSGYAWSYLLCLGLAGASAATVIYVRSRQRSAS